MDEEKVFGLHSTQHSFACRLFENGVDVKTVSTILGHADVGVTYNTYIHLLKNQQQTAVDILDQIWRLNHRSTILWRWFFFTAENIKSNVSLI